MTQIIRLLWQPTKISKKLEVIFCLIYLTSFSDNEISINRPQNVLYPQIILFFLSDYRFVQEFDIRYFTLKQDSLDQVAQIRHLVWFFFCKWSSKQSLTFLIGIVFLLTCIIFAYYVHAFCGTLVQKIYICLQKIYVKVYPNQSHHLKKMGG